MRLLLSIALFFSGATSTLPAHNKATPSSFEYLAGSATTYAIQDPSPTPTPAESPTPTPDPELERLKREQAIADAEKAKSQAEKEAAEARKAAAQAEQEMIEARLASLKARMGIGAASPTATPPSGNITGDGAGKFIETQLLAEMSARKASQLMASNLCNSQSATLKVKPIQTLIISSTTDKAATDSYQAILLQLRFFNEEYERLINEAVAAQKLLEAAPTPTPGVTASTEGAESAIGALPLIVPAATQAVKTFADLVNMFRTETEFKDQQVTVDARMVMAFLAEELFKLNTDRCKLQVIYQPAVYSLSIQDSAADGPIMEAYTDVVQAMSRGDGSVADKKMMIAPLTNADEAKDAEIAKLKKQIEDAVKKSAARQPAPAASSAPSSKGKKKKPVAQQPAQPAFDLAAGKQKLAQAEADKLYLNTKIERLRRTATNIEAFRAAIADALKLMTGVNAAGNETVLAGLLRAERLRGILADQNTYALDLAIRASGTNRFTRTAFFNTKVAHSGGVSLSINLFNHLDQMVYGRQEGYYIEFSHSKDIRRRAGFQPLDPTFRQ
jgi:hypothetical protein